MRRKKAVERFVKVRKIIALQPGDKFYALIQDVQPTMIKLLLENGESLMARSQVYPDARIGEQAAFMVKDNQQGKIMLELVKTGESDKRNTFDMRV
jgi:hypothetical protein